MIWWHKKVLKHEVTESRVSVGMFDSSRGILYKCECGKVWAK